MQAFYFTFIKTKQASTALNVKTVSGSDKQTHKCFIRGPCVKAQLNRKYTYASHSKSPLSHTNGLPAVPTGTTPHTICTSRKHRHNMKVKDEERAGERRPCEVQIKSNAGSLTSLSFKSRRYSAIPQKQVESYRLLSFYYYQSLINYY